MLDTSVVTSSAIEGVAMSASKSGKPAKKSKPQTNAESRKSADWQKRFNNVLRKIQVRSSQLTPEEIEADITRAVREVRRRA